MVRLAPRMVGHEAGGEASELSEASQAGAERQRGQPRCVCVAQSGGCKAHEGGEGDAEEEERRDGRGEGVHPEARVAVSLGLNAKALREVLTEGDVQEGEQEVPNK